MITPDTVQEPSDEEIEEATKLLNDFFEEAQEAQIQGSFADACVVFSKYKEKLEAAAKIAAFFGPKGRLASAAILAFVGVCSSVCSLAGKQLQVDSPAKY
ncbi:hypothetical protein ABLU95_21745 [Klebsiella sp. GG_Kp146]|uniref:hypothetical protein n=1 Tax=Klebsiella sp. GG_Kp146 TaxID=3153457 RepID=UPI0032B445C1